MKRLVVGVSVIGVAAAVAVGFLARGRAAGAAPYRLATVERGDVTSTVSATGTLGAVSTVQVGTQVSGQIAELNADYNSHVRQGQLIARLDSTLLSLAVRQAEAAVRQARADSVQKQFALDQATTLFETGLSARADYIAALTANETAQASLTSAEVNLDKARENLRYAYIYAPIEGTVVERNVSVGQTVASSFTAPQLFLIAADLRRMQILAAVDEADIGAIRVGQAVRFTVQAYPDRTFTGTVRQVRLQSATTDNVVSYTAVVGVDNPDLALLPGMTATVTFQVASAADVFKVANAALRFRAPEAWLARWRAAQPDSARGAAVADSASSGLAALWVLDGAGAGAGQPTRILVRPGLSDGVSTEISGPAVRAGLRVVVGTASSEAVPSGTASPFQGTQQRAGPPPPGGF
jgi:HlyD family secretion protein